MEYDSGRVIVKLSYPVECVWMVSKALSRLRFTCWMAIVLYRCADCGLRPSLMAQPLYFRALWVAAMVLIVSSTRFASDFR